MSAYHSVKFTRFFNQNTLKMYDQYGNDVIRVACCNYVRPLIKSYNCFFQIILREFCSNP